MNYRFSRHLLFVGVGLLANLCGGPQLYAQGARSGVRGDGFSDSDEPALSARSNGVDFGLAGNNEPCIVVNPLNSQNIAYASLFRSRVSTNGGTSWTGGRAPSLPAGYSTDGDSTMAFDSQGRLFWQYLGVNNGTGRGEILIIQLSPTAGTFIGSVVRITTTGAAGTGDNDKGWVAADRFVASPFRDRLYVAWSEYQLGGVNQWRVLFSYSTNQGATWSPSLQLSIPADGGFPWPTHVAVAPNGDVYVSYHDGYPYDGVTGKVFVLRSTDGGVSFPQKNLAFTAGQADITTNVQGQPGTVPGTNFWLQGSAQAWIVPDATIPGNVYVVASDDPDNTHGSGDESNIYIARSTNNGVSWNAPIRVDHGRGTTFAVMPTAAMDDSTARMAVTWYAPRLGSFNSSGLFLLDVYYTTSDDHGLTWCADRRINDAPVDPSLGAPARFYPPPTGRIGEYNGLAMGGGNLYAVWCGNTATGQQTIFDSVVGVTGSCSDCNNNTIPDAIEIAGNPSLDCNNDGVLDSCEITADAGRDCNTDGILDECQLAGRDCDGNGVIDSCEIAANPALDCNHNGILDRCEPNGGDCNGDGVSNFCEVDCNGNSVSDICELAGNVAAADQCVNAPRIVPGVYMGTTYGIGVTNDGTDSCNAAGALPPDVWYKYVPVVSGSATVSLCGTTFDTILSIHPGCPGTSSNQLICGDDYCNAASQVTFNVTAGQSYLIRITGFANPPGTGDTGDFVMKLTGPAAYAAHDCNGNGILDACEIASGTSLDCNANGIPDQCEFPGCAGITLADMNCDARRDGRDIQRFAADFVLGRYSCEADMNQDGVLNDLDIGPFANAVLNGP